MHLSTELIAGRRWLVAQPGGLTLGFALYQVLPHSYVQHKMRLIITHVALQVSLCVCLFVEHSSELTECCKTAEPIEVSCGRGSGQTRVDQSNRVLDRVHIGPTWRIRWNDLCCYADAGCRYQFCSKLEVWEKLSPLFQYSIQYT